MPWGTSTEKVDDDSNVSRIAKLAASCKSHLETILLVPYKELLGSMYRRLGKGIRIDLKVGGYQQRLASIHPGYRSRSRKEMKNVMLHIYPGWDLPVELLCVGQKYTPPIIHFVGRVVT